MGFGCFVVFQLCCCFGFAFRVMVVRVWLFVGLWVYIVSVSVGWGFGFKGGLFWGVIWLSWVVRYFVVGFVLLFLLGVNVLQCFALEFVLEVLVW